MSDGVFWPEFKAWLAEHGIPTEDAYDVTVSWTAETVREARPVQMVVSWWCTNEQGHRYIGDDGEVAGESRLVTMRHLPAVEVVRYRDEAAG